MKKIEIGQTIKIVCMKGEPQYTGKIGSVQHIDSMGQAHGTWAVSLSNPRMTNGR